MAEGSTTDIQEANIIPDNTKLEVNRRWKLRKLTTTTTFLVIFFSKLESDFFLLRTKTKCKKSRGIQEKKTNEIMKTTIKAMCVYFTKNANKTKKWN